MARLVLNHSTLLPGLQKVLSRLAASTRISAVVPGRLYPASKRRTNSGGEALLLKLTTASSSAHTGKVVSQKILARRESLAQEVFLSFGEHTACSSSAEIAEHLRELLGRDASVRVVLQSEKKEKEEKRTEMEKSLRTDFQWRA